MIEMVQNGLIGCIVLVALSLPPGLATQRLVGMDCPPLIRVAVALGLGLVEVLFALLLELTIGWPVLILPLFAASMMALGPIKWIGSKELAPDLALAFALGGLAFLANYGDVREDASGLSVRVGFDVSDPAFYGTVAQELERAPIWALENPAFAPLPLQYSTLPALAGVLVHRYAGLDPLYAFRTCLPAFGLFFSALAAAAMAKEFGSLGWIGRAVPAVLVTLGGDLSYLVPVANSTWLERARHFFVFYSFSGESLLYNPWMLGLPLAFVSILCLGWSWRGQRWASVLPAGIVLVGLFETKAFAFIPIWLALTIYAALARSARLLAVAALSLLLALPGILLLAPTAGVRGGGPLEFAPLAFVRQSISDNPSIEGLANFLGFPLAAVVIVLGGFGFRAIGVGPLIRLSRGEGGVTARVCGLTILIGTILALMLVGRPNRIDGVQFMFLPHFLLWVFAGLTLGRMLRGGVPRRLLALLVVGLSLVTPVRYLAAKNFPERFTSAGAVDRSRFLLSPATVGAARWFKSHSLVTSRLALPLSGDPEDRGGLKAPYVGLVASRRVVAHATAFHVSHSLARNRQAAVERLFDTTDAAEGEALLHALRADWIWEASARPLRFSSPRLSLRAEFDATRLYKVEPTP